MAIWLVFAVLTACVILTIARPLLRPSSLGEEGVSEVAAYKLQLEELSRDEERGTIGRDEAARTRAEISRRHLKAGRGKAAPPPAKEKGFDAKTSYASNVAFMALAAVMGLGAIGLYAFYGSPAEPDQPLEARMNVPLEQQTLAIQIANVERRLRANPEDLMGWNVLAPVYFRTEQFDKAANAYRRTIELGGETEDRLYGLFESLDFANNGMVPPGAKAILDRALSLNPKSLRGRFWLAIVADQDGHKADAEQIYRQMLSENIAPSWKAVIGQRLAALNSQPEVADASGAAGAEDQSGMIRGMVERLGARLKESGGSLEDWLRLIRSYRVLKETAKAEEATASARQQFAGDPKTLAQIAEQADATGQEIAAAPPAPAVQSDASQGDQSAMIRGMVERLSARLKESGGSLEDWLRLIRSYAMLRETGKAQDAVVSARQTFSSEPQALQEIDNLMSGLGLTMPETNRGQPKS